MNYEEIVNYIDNIPKFKKKPGTEKAEELLRRIGFDEDKHKIIHVAGTNGKGSVCAYMNSVLTEHKHSVGLFTSPHLVKVNERIRINGTDIPDDMLSEAFEVIRDVNEAMIKDGYDGINYFDFFFGMAMWCFKKAAVEYIILETGIGGIYDSTNSIKRPVLCIIASISFDHTEVLGQTISEIASSKAGIIKDNALLAYSGLSEEANEVFIAAIKSHNNVISSHTLKSTPKDIVIDDGHLSYRISDFGFDTTVELSTSAVYQADNSALVLCALRLLADHTDFVYDEAAVIKALKETHWQGRMEYAGDNLYIDGAHNEDGIRRFLESMQLLKKGRKVHLLFTAVKEKNTEEMIEAICTSNIFDSYTVTTLYGPRAIPPRELADEFLKHTDECRVTAVKDIEEALKTLRKNMSGDDIGVCAGSLYLVGEIKALLKQKDKETV